MRTITVRLPAVEAAMLLEVQKSNKKFRDMQALFIELVREAYKAGGRAN